jgi:hypothetical protein
MVSRTWPVALAASVLSGCLAGHARIGTGVDTLALYGEAYATGAVGFSCTPAVYPGGPGDPRYERMRHELRDRRLRVKERLALDVGVAAIEKIEREQDEQEHGIYRTGCDVQETDEARFRYRTLLSELERRTGLRR